MFTPEDISSGMRLDQAIARYLPDISREKAKKAIQVGAVWVNKKRVQIHSRKIGPGDLVTLYKGAGGWTAGY